jgi:hypothetical protein
LGGRGGFGYTRSGASRRTAAEGRRCPLEEEGKNYSAACAAGFFGGKRP